MRIGTKYIPPLALLMVSIAGTAYAATVLFTQTFPAISSSGITSNCPTLSAEPGATAGVTAGSNGQIGFDCSGSQAFGSVPAFSIAATTTLTPMFALPGGYTTLRVTAVGTSPCSFGSELSTVISNGTPIQLGAGSYDYCAGYSNAPVGGLATFDIQWTI